MNSKDFYDKYGLVAQACPFCTFSDIELCKEKRKVFVKCLYCKKTGPRSIFKSQAVKKWNRRIDIKSYCIFCGKKLKNNFCEKCKIDFLRKQNMKKEYVCCYLDLLGFSNYTLHFDLEDSVRLIEDYATIFQHRSVTNCFKSFEYFHPASDSVFVIGTDFNRIVEDIANFCEQSFELVSMAYFSPENSNDVSEVSVTEITLKGIVNKKEHWFPPIFSGGVSTGDLLIFTQEAFYSGTSIQVPNFVGDALTKAVHLGEKADIHGARIICDSVFVDKLNQTIRDKFIFFHNGCYELLWPCAYFIDANTVDNNINNGINQTFSTLLKFYNQFRHNGKLEAVYFNTLKLFFVSLKQYLIFRQASQQEIQKADSIIENMLIHNNLKYIKNELSDLSIWR